MKYVVLVLVLVAVVWWVRSRSRPSRPPGDGHRGASAKPPPQEIVQCAHCGVHLPRAEAVVEPGSVFCSEAHRLAHRPG